MESLRIRPLERSDFTLVRHISVAPEQVIFSGTVAMAFESEEPGIDLHGVFLGAHAIGFFKIDHKYPDTQVFAQPGDLGLRAFLIDHGHQGRGLGSRASAALGPYLTERYPKARAVALTANLRNPVAIHIYKKAGFIDTGELFEGGIAGPQHVMRLALRSDTR